MLAGALLAGCQSAETTPQPPPPSVQSNPTAAAVPLQAIAPEPQPIDMAPGGSKPVVFQRVIISMESGAKIGQVTGGLLNVVQSTIKASQGEGSKQFGFIGRSELHKAHYTMLGDDNQLFSEDEPLKARYQLGANITWMQLNMHVQPGWNSATVRSDGVMTVEWQVYDTLSQKVIFKRTTDIGFHESVKNGEGEAAIFGMFRKSVRQLLAEPEFAAFMRPDAGGSDAGASAPAELPLAITGPKSAERLQLPTDFPAVLDSFLTLEPGAGFGSAFLISPDGYALTAAHVVSGLKTVPARLRGGVVLEAEVVRLNVTADIALVKLPGSSYKPLVLALNSPASIGTDVYAVGNPAAKELTASVSKGVVSGNREIEGRKFIQTDAAANPGSSGGPLLDKNGQVIGIISWKVAGPKFQGLAFAVPIQEGLDRMHVTLMPPAP
jgi:S1-C subfamily serine protease